MTDFNTYNLQVQSKTDIPDDVVVEHVAYALRAISDPSRRRARKGDIKVELLSVQRPRKHPFEGGNVVFDDEVTPETFTYGTSTYSTDVFSGKAEEPRDETVAFTGFVEPVIPEVMIDVSDLMPEIIKAIHEDFPYLSELFADKREEANIVKRRTDATEPPAEGEWELPTEDHVGGDID